MINLGELIRKRREACGWRQYELARHAEMSAAQVSLIENNRVSPSFYAVERLARAFDTDIAGLLSQANGKAAPIDHATTTATFVRGDYIALRALECDGAAALAAIEEDERQANAAERSHGVVKRLPLREQFRAYYRAHPEAMEPHPPAAPLSPISIAEAQ